MTRALSLRQIVTIATTLWLFSPSAPAQSDAETLADLRACGTVERDTARLACFDGVLANERTAATERTATSERTTAQERAARRAAAADSETAVAATAARDQRDAPGENRAAENERPRTLTIVDVNDTLPGAARFTADTGRVFVQTSGGTPRGGYPDVPFEARIQDGAFGSLFLYVSERRRVRGIWAD
jgi:hypothetical protein